MLHLHELLPRREAGLFHLRIEAGMAVAAALALCHPVQRQENLVYGCIVQVGFGTSAVHLGKILRRRRRPFQLSDRPPSSASDAELASEASTSCCRLPDVAGLARRAEASGCSSTLSSTTSCSSAAVFPFEKTVSSCCSADPAASSRLSPAAIQWPFYLVVIDKFRHR